MHHFGERLSLRNIIFFTVNSLFLKWDGGWQVARYTAAFSFQYTPAIFRNKLTNFLVFEQSSLARNEQMDEFDSTVMKELPSRHMTSE